MRYAVVMAGGTGTRFWPVSRKSLPKQLLRIGGGKTLLTRTVDRISPLVDPDRILIATGDLIADKIAAEVPDLPAKNIISEPLRRNTAACIALAAKVLHDRDPEAVMLVLAADHLIQKEDVFRQTADAAMNLAENEEVLITFGISPSYPETGYGYIEMGEKAGESLACPYHEVAAFHEKPTKELAVQYFESKNFAWNSGMFAFRAKVLLEATAKHLPEIYRAVQAVDGKSEPAQIKEKIGQIYPGLPALSVDTGIMEKADNIFVFPADIGWSDVGAWTALCELVAADKHGNVAQGEHLVLNGKNNTIYAQDGLVVVIGAEDLIVVHTPDVTLVARRDDAQAVKKIYDELEKRGLDPYM